MHNIKYLQSIKKYFKVPSFIDAVVCCLDNDDTSFTENLKDRTVNNVFKDFLFVHSFQLNIFEEILIVIAVFKASQVLPKYIFINENNF